MFKKSYIIVFDKSEIDYGQLHNIILNLHKERVVTNWWHYIKTCYILISDRSANDLSTIIANNLISNKKFLVAEINLNNRQGWLSQEAWDWIKDEMARI